MRTNECNNAGGYLNSSDSLARDKSRMACNLMKKGDFVVFIILIIILTASFTFFYAGGNEEYPLNLVVRVDGKIYREIKLDPNFENVIEISSKFGYNRIEIENGQVHMSDADCKDRLCVDTPAISRTHQSVICLPNRVMICLEGKSGLDYVSY